MCQRTSVSFCLKKKKLEKKWPPNYRITNFTLFFFRSGVILPWQFYRFYAVREKPYIYMSRASLWGFTGKGHVHVQKNILSRRHDSSFTHVNMH